MQARTATTRRRPALVSAALTAGFALAGLSACGSVAPGLHAGVNPSCPTPAPVPTLPAASGSLDISRYAVPGPNPGMQRITAGPDGALWFAGGTVDTDVIGRVTTAGAITLFHPPTPHSAPFGITAGPDGNIWFTEQGRGRIGRLAPDTGQIEEFPLPLQASWSPPPPTADVSTHDSRPGDIVAGLDGDLWFTAWSPSYLPASTPGSIGRITPAGTVTMYPLHQGEPLSIQVGSDGNLWSRVTSSDPCKAYQSSATLVRVTLTGEMTQVAETSPQFAADTIGPDGSRWWLTATGAVRRTSATGEVTTSSTHLPVAAGAAMYHFAIAPDGNLWYAAGGAGIVRVTPSGELTVYAPPPMSAPVWVVRGPDGRMWVVDGSSSLRPFVGAIGIAGA